MTEKAKEPAAVVSAKADIYRMLVEMADRVSQRRQAANNFYLSVNTALIGASAYLSTLRPMWASLAVIAVAGIAISLLCMRNIDSYRTLNAAKFRVITDLEKTLPVQAFTEEWTHLDPDGDGERHVPFHRVEGAVPWVFALVHLAQLGAAIPWSQVIAWVAALCRA